MTCTVVTVAILGLFLRQPTIAFSLWFGSSDYDEAPSPYGPAPVDYGECDWFDATMQQPQPLPAVTSSGFGYDFEAQDALRGGGHRSPYPNFPNQNPFFGNFRTGRSFGFMSAPDEPYNADDLTAAHRTLPAGSYVTVVNENNQRSVVVRIVDNRGPNVVGRVMTLSQAAFHQIADLDERTVPCYVSMK